MKRFFENNIEIPETVKCALIQQVCAETMAEANEDTMGAFFKIIQLPPAGEGVTTFDPTKPTVEAARISGVALAKLLQA
eukprot:12702522-Alexandrium_andersonii.AAC.1